MKYISVIISSIIFHIVDNLKLKRKQVEKLSRKYQTKLFIKYLITFHILLLHSLIDTLLCAIVHNVHKDLSLIIDVDVNVVI